MNLPSLIAVGILATIIAFVILDSAVRAHSAFVNMKKAREEYARRLEIIANEPNPLITDLPWIVMREAGYEYQPTTRLPEIEFVEPVKEAA